MWSMLRHLFQVGLHPTSRNQMPRLCRSQQCYDDHKSPTGNQQLTICDQMPYGLSWPKYLTFVTAAFISMFAGAQVVHSIYEPLKDFPEYVEREKSRLRALQEETPP